MGSRTGNFLSWGRGRGSGTAREQSLLRGGEKSAQGQGPSFPLPSQCPQGGGDTRRVRERCKRPACRRRAPFWDVPKSRAPGSWLCRDICQELPQRAGRVESRASIQKHACLVGGDGHYYQGGAWPVRPGLFCQFGSQSKETQLWRGGSVRWEEKRIPCTLDCLGRKFLSLSLYSPVSDSTEEKPTLLWSP